MRDKQRKCVRECVNHEDVQKSMGLEGLHPRALRELADTILRLSITLERFLGEGGS